MISHCLNPACAHPENLTHTERCQACGGELLLRGRYRAVQQLGRGGFGATFLAVDESLPGQPSCVIKQLRPGSNSPQVVQMARELFQREAKTLGKIGDYPQVPRLLDYFEHNQEFYLVQEYVNGSTLQQEVRTKGPFTEAEVKKFLGEILPVLQYIHNSQVIHRDIKPANIIRRVQDQKLVLIDFGAVKDEVNQTMITDNSQTALTNFAIGTAGFAPPEQMAMRPVFASDLYALGVTCIYLLTGRSPKDIEYDQGTGEMKWRQYCQVSDHFVGIIRKMLEVSVRQRFQSANDVLRALDLEPYLDSLTQGISNQTNQNPGPSTAGTSGKVRVIPKRPTGEGREELAHESSGRPAKIPPASLTAQGLVAAYSRGQRDFSDQDFSSMNLEKFELTGAMFHGTKFLRTNLQGANLFNSNFGRARLNQANLRNANLAKGYFSYADLEGADLRGADLSQAYLSNANLRGANLCGSNLTGAKITDDQLALAKTNWTTVRPEGKRGRW